ncbi:MAG: hypothetical protein IPH82_26925 [Chloroflexi bacterium]|nr:hypothetical protein [Chloroflexota bacterium]
MDNELTVIDQREVELYGDMVTAIRADDGEIYVSLRQMCDVLGLSRQAQVRRIKRQEILAEGYKGGAVLAPPSAEGRGGGVQQAGVLRVDLVPLWLSGVSVKAVKLELQAKLAQLQRNAARLLWQAFQSGELTVDTELESLLAQDSEAAQAYRMAVAVVKLAKNQVLLEAKLQRHDVQIEDLESRLSTIEADMHDTARTISESQATQISQGIRAIALHMSEKSNQNEYGRTWGEFYRKFGVSKYRHLPDCQV